MMFPCLVGSTWSVLLSVVSGRGILCGRVIRARLVFWRSGASGMGANAVERKSTFFWCFQNECAEIGIFFGVFKMSARPCLPPLRAFATIGASTLTCRIHLENQTSVSQSSKLAFPFRSFIS